MIKKKNENQNRISKNCWKTSKDITYRQLEYQKEDKYIREENKYLK